MPQEIYEPGYQSIRDWLQSADGWDYVGLIDDADNEVARIEISTDGRASWVHAQDAQTLEVEISITGGDADIDAPSVQDGIVLVGSASFDDTEANTTTRLAEDSFPSARLVGADDELTITHQVEVPEVV